MKVMLINTHNRYKEEDFYTFDSKTSILYFNDYKFDLSLLIENDKKSIINDVNSKRFVTNYMSHEANSKYEEYDTTDIQLEEILIYENICIELIYTINGGEYRRIANGNMAPIYYSSLTPEGNILICPKYCAGKVAW